MPAAACALCRAPALPTEEPLDAPRDNPQSFNGSGWRVTSPTSLPSTSSTRSPSFPTPAAPTRPRPRSSGAVGAHGRVAHHRNWPHRHRGDPGAVGRAAGACNHRDPGGLQTLGPDPIPTPLTAAISCFVTLRRGRQLVYERNMIDELALRLVHGELPVGS
jgi:hypothetical protein